MAENKTYFALCLVGLHRFINVNNFLVYTQLCTYIGAVIFRPIFMQAWSLCQFSTGEFIENNRLTVERSSTRVGPVAYPWGFPVMLAPVYATFGLHFLALKMVGVLFYLGLLVVMWYEFARFHTPLWRSACVLLFTVHPTLIGFTNHVLSDIPFYAFRP